MKRQRWLEMYFLMFNDTEKWLLSPPSVVCVLALLKVDIVTPSKKPPLPHFHHQLPLSGYHLQFENKSNQPAFGLGVKIQLFLDIQLKKANPRIVCPQGHCKPPRGADQWTFELFISSYRRNPTHLPKG